MWLLARFQYHDVYEMLHIIITIFDTVTKNSKPLIETLSITLFMVMLSRLLSYIVNIAGYVNIHNHCAAVTIGYTIRGLECVDAS